jgi:hypothetical protein
MYSIDVKIYYKETINGIHDSMAQICIENLHAPTPLVKKGFHIPILIPKTVWSTTSGHISPGSNENVGQKKN